jgi:uncharacterized surface protein with fasciclin (FAS1) repeats
MKTKHIPKALLLLGMTAFTPNIMAKEDAAEKSTTSSKATVNKGSLTATIQDSVSFSTLTKALVAAELDVTLGGNDEYTIFAPTDEAFGKLKPEVLTKLLLPENKEKLRSLLLYHVVPGKVMAADLKSGDVKTMNGEKAKVSVGNNKIEVEGHKVFSADVVTNNGILHTIGTVLIPASLEGFAGLDK